ncbi:MAG: DsbA family protein [Solirubrobacterales bacterium]
MRPTAEPGAGEGRRRSAWVPRLLLGLGALTLLAAVISIAVGSGGPKPVRIVDLGPVQQLFGGIVQEGAELGDPDADVTISLFTDLRCTECADYQIATVDPLVEELARTGRARFDLRHYSLGSESTTLAAAAAVAAGEQGRQWQYADLLLRNLDAAGAEVDDEFLVDVANSLPNLDVDIWERDRASDQVASVIEADDEEGTALKLQSDGPSVLVSGPGGTEVLGTEPSAAQISAAVERVT